MGSSASKIKLSPVAELLGYDEDIIESGEFEKVIHVPLENLHSFQNHPFKVLNDEKMEETKESISQRGVLVPIIARPKGDGQYEIISGHRRKYACDLLGKETIPTLVRDLDDEESTIIMVDSNIQRENLLFSEKAFAFKMKLEAIKKQGKRTDLTCDQVGHKLNKSVEVVAEESGESQSQIKRYIRLTELTNALLDMVDDKRIAFNTGVEISYLAEDEQEMLLSKIIELDVIPSLSQATKLKKYSLEKSLTIAVIEIILLENKTKPVQITLKAKELNKYFPEGFSSEKIEETIFFLLEEWKLRKN